LFVIQSNGSRVPDFTICRPQGPITTLPLPVLALLRDFLSFLSISFFFTPLWSTTMEPNRPSSWSSRSIAYSIQFLQGAAIKFEKQSKSKTIPLIAHFDQPRPFVLIRLAAPFAASPLGWPDPCSRILLVSACNDVIATNKPWISSPSRTQAPRHGTVQPPFAISEIRPPISTHLKDATKRGSTIRHSRIL
jgi:hypothetical protein